MSKDMHPSNWQTEAEQAYELLAEKGAEIERLQGDWSKQVLRADKAESEIVRLHGQLNVCTKRGTEAERKMVEARQYVGDVGCWQKRAYDAEAKVKQLEKNLKKAMNDLRDMSNIKYQFAPAYLFIDMANKALADIEGEPYRHQGVSSDHTGASNQPEQIHGEPDWEEIKKRKDNDMAKALLHLRDKLSKLENTVEDIQAWIIKNG